MCHAGSSSLVFIHQFHIASDSISGSYFNYYVHKVYFAEIPSFFLMLNILDLQWQKPDFKRKLRSIYTNNGIVHLFWFFGLVKYLTK